MLTNRALFAEFLLPLGLVGLYVLREGQVPVRCVGEPYCASFQAVGCEVVVAGWEGGTGSLCLLKGQTLEAW